MELLTDPLGGSGQSPRYLRIAQALAADIADGRYEVGGMLPTEAELCALFGVSRSTVREALRRLTVLGLVSRTQGIGTRVVQRHAKSTYIMSAQSVDRVMQYAAETELTLQVIEDVVADKELVATIGGVIGQRWLLFSGTRAVPRDEQGTFCHTRAYVAGRYGAVRSSIGLGGPPLTTPIYQAVCQTYGIAIGEIRQTMRAEAASPDDAALLNVAEGSPVLRIVRHYITTDGETLEVSVNTYPAGRFEYSMRLRITPAGAP
ncbi:GntR family transcriptional regulator [Acuticoccus sediminis]|uniref:GntR family transcriptional regulator n=1 Tax=Acuticoccus sediminis TaxID=2184697 RepID=UPI001CFF1B8E|nr:GntR family transcriptional regulator [Acuticoccus sediminis]